LSSTSRHRNSTSGAIISNWAWISEVKCSANISLNLISIEMMLPRALFSLPLWAAFSYLSAENHIAFNSFNSSFELHNLFLVPLYLDDLSGKMIFFIWIEK
jgi:hypothetical protein